MGKSLNSPLWAMGAALALGVTLLVDDLYLSSVLNLLAISALIAVCLRFVMLIGELNFATAAFVGIGAYGTAVFTTMWGWNFLLAIFASGLLAAAVSAVFGWITLRTKGPYFLLIGFAFTEAVRIIYSKIPALGGNSGLVGIFPPVAMDPWMSTFIMGLCTASIFALYLLERSDFGRVLLAIRDNENVARTVGLNVLLLKVLCFALASFFAGIAGSLHALANNVISPGDFSYLMAAFALAYVKVGGEDNILGPIVGTLLLVSLGSYFLGFGGQEHIFYGGAIILAVLALPQGITGLARRGLARLRPQGKGV